MSENILFEKKLMEEIIRLALIEDKANDCVTTNSLIEFDKKILASVHAKEDGIISGTQVFSEVFKTIDPLIEITLHVPDGNEVKKGDVVLEIQGLESSILKAERTALNFLQRLSGIASLTRKYTDSLKSCTINLLDTRKTTPGMRYLEKQAVRHGGGTNHRMNLKDMAMIKDNHIKMAGSIKKAVKLVRKNHPDIKIEVEVKNIIELKEALFLDVEIIMLDNFTREHIREAVKLKKDNVKFEISGNVKLDNIREKAIPGIDFISVGALTHSFKSLDLSLNIIDHS
jgi:nicotinate-nucleotide pyrophosphorylase (carboxylating)